MKFKIEYDFMQKICISYEVEANSEEEACEIAEKLAHKANDIDELPNADVERYGSIYGKVDRTGIADVYLIEGEDE